MYENWASSISDFYCSFGFSTYKPNVISQKLNLAQLYILMNWYDWDEYLLRDLLLMGQIDIVWIQANIFF